MIEFIKRPNFPKRAVITAGMPYGNKELHLGHIGGVFVHADIYRRFLQDRIGKENVIFVSGTDCYGSPIVEYYKKHVEESGYTGSLEDYVTYNHNRQRSSLEAYNISTKSYYTSGFGSAGEIHREFSQEILNSLYKNGKLKKLSTPQFYDKKFNTLLNGRQVIGKCPIPGCKSEKAYSGECELGHPFPDNELINPISILSNETPEMIDVTNWYIDLVDFKKKLDEWITTKERDPQTRKNVLSSVKEFVQPPAIYIKNEFADEITKLKTSFPEHTISEDKKSVILTFNSLEDREDVSQILDREGVRYRKGKTLTPFRLTGNIEWSIKAPELEGLKDLTFWVWPESLWAPISFTKNYLNENKNSNSDWQDWWCTEDSEVYQFMGEDNTYFYSIAQHSIFTGALESVKPTKLIANCHLLQGNKKASSSGDEKPIMAMDLLNYYTPDQLRAHFFSLGLSMRSVNFNPKPFNSDAKEKDADPVMKEGNLLSNVLNRICRSCFYTTQKHNNGVLPYGEVSEAVLKDALKIILEWERRMYNTEYHKAMFNLEKYIRGISKYWAKNMTGDFTEEHLQVLVDTFHMVKTAISLLHPVAPKGSEMVSEYLKLDRDIFNWDNIFNTLYDLTDTPENHRLKWLEPRIDFFEKHPYQV